MKLFSLILANHLFKATLPTVHPFAAVRQPQFPWDTDADDQAAVPGPVKPVALGDEAGTKNLIKTCEPIGPEGDGVVRDRLFLDGWRGDGQPDPLFLRQEAADGKLGPEDLIAFLRHTRKTLLGLLADPIMPFAKEDLRFLVSHVEAGKDPFQGLVGLVEKATVFMRLGRGHPQKTVLEVRDATLVRG